MVVTSQKRCKAVGRVNMFCAKSDCTETSYAVITIMRFDYDPTTTYRACLLPIRREQEMNTLIFRRSRIVVESQVSFSSRFQNVCIKTKTWSDVCQITITEAAPNKFCENIS